MLSEDLQRFCRDRWVEWMDEPPPDGLNLCLVPSRVRSSERAVALVFHRRRLRVVLKLATSDRESLQRERAALSRLDGVPGLRHLVPRVLAADFESLRYRPSPSRSSYTVWVLSLSPVRGRVWRPPDASEPLSGRAFAKVEAVLREVDGISRALADALGHEGWNGPGAGWLDGLERLPIDESARRDLRDHYGRFPGADTSLRSWAHGDLAPGNVRVDRTGVRAVLDWEMCGSGYEPWFDRLYPALLAVSSVCLSGGSVPYASWPLRWLRLLADEPGAIPVRLRCLCATAQLAERAQRLERGSFQRWATLAEYLNGLDWTE